jgi:8-oxo-dGTP pyrophosphatase MutT (NUDIX family)
VRALIENRLASYEPATSLEQGLLANVEGPISDRLRAAILDPGRHAAVLLGLVERTSGLTVLLTERARDLAHHAGQVAFPGGRLEGPDETTIDAALREAWEEVGLAPADVHVVAELAEHVTGTGFRVTPIVGFVDGGFVPRADPAEVEQVFEVPLDFVLDAANYRLRYRERFGSRFRTYELEYNEFLIWGATAAMLVTFRDILLKT